MMPRKRDVVLITIIITAVFIGGATFFQVQKNRGGRDVAEKQPETISVPEAQTEPSSKQTITSSFTRETTNFARKETVLCNNEKYIIAVSLNKYYFTDIYKDSPMPENLLLRIRTGIEGPLKSPLTVLAVPQKDCDTIFMTRLHPEVNQNRYSIFAWKVGNPNIRELAIGEEFSQSLPDDYNWNTIASSDGERVLSVISFGTPIPREKRWSCYYRALLIFHLREDRSETLVRLPDAETFDSGFSEAGTCDGVKIGWLDASTIYYDVYDAISAKLLERRTLTIK